MDFFYMFVFKVFAISIGLLFIMVALGYALYIFLMLTFLLIDLTTCYKYDIGCKFISITNKCLLYLGLKPLENGCDDAEVLKELTLYDDTCLLEKYCKDDLYYIFSILKDKKHPHINIIQDNFDKLVELINEKEIELESTVSQRKQLIIEKNIKEIIEKYILLIENINKNLFTNNLCNINNLETYFIETLNKFNNKEINIEIFIQDNGALKELDFDKINVMYNSLYDYFEDDDIDEYKKLGKMLKNNKNSYYKTIIYLLERLIDDISSLENIFNYLPEETLIDIKNNIKNCISSYTLLLIEFDNICDLPKDIDIDNYKKLLDGIMDDIESKKTVF